MTSALTCDHIRYLEESDVSGMLQLLVFDVLREKPRDLLAFIEKWALTRPAAAAEAAAGGAKNTLESLHAVEIVKPVGTHRYDRKKITMPWEASPTDKPAKQVATQPTNEV